MWIDLLLDSVMFLKCGPLGTSKISQMPSLDLCLILLLNVGRVAAQQESGSVCYILDAILIVYGVVLTVLYCRLKMRSSHGSFSEKPEGDIYQDLGRHDADTYETLHNTQMKKKPLA